MAPHHPLNRGILHHCYLMFVLCDGTSDFNTHKYLFCKDGEERIRVLITGVTNLQFIAVPVEKRTRSSALCESRENV